jgi:uncharacterized coiled-coil DUF342 family protein
MDNTLEVKQKVEELNSQINQANEELKNLSDKRGLDSFEIGQLKKKITELEAARDTLQAQLTETVC